MDMYSFGELHDMPMKRLEKRIPGARPTKNKKKDSQIVQPSRQVRKIKKYAIMLMKNEIVLMILYRLMLFWWIVSLVSWCYSKFGTCSCSYRLIIWPDTMPPIDTPTVTWTYLIDANKSLMSSTRVK